MYIIKKWEAKNKLSIILLYVNKKCNINYIRVLLLWIIWNCVMWIIVFGIFFKERIFLSAQNKLYQKYN